MPRRLGRWAVAGWIVLVVAAAALTLYLRDRPDATTPGPPHWERVPDPASEPVPCPERSGGGVAPTARGCTYWERGQGRPPGPSGPRSRSAEEPV
ncbi:hypothetical protein ACFXG6_08495 [Streptomyces roseus]|uniref:hypothetical protein n=1 Tax=Streptomyces roseus TaxID=66430 RepID=UPI00369CED75